MCGELRVRDYGLGGNGLEAYYFEAEERELRAMAIDPDVEPERRRLWELVAHGMECVPSTTRRLIGTTTPETTGFYFFAPCPKRGPEPLAVNAAAKVIAELEPEWVLDIVDARLVADDERVIAAWSGVPIEAVMAVLGNWRARL
jgi:hypothetical protein